MSYEVLARKWRPQQFDDVVGQGHVTETLKNAIKTGRVAHAYIFVGPRGIGKTSVARIFAKALNCVDGPTVKPCGKCDSCKEIVDGRNLDVLEIDGASNNSVDQVRDLRDTVKYLPVRGPHKIYIIDEVHMLSTQAFNALLKTLEEPPPHVKFLFATTEANKVLTTILSRCQRFDLRRITLPETMKRLREVARSEGVEVDDDALLGVARGAEGSLRDAESALDQLISFKGKKITEADVLSIFGLVSRGALDGLAEAILKGDVRSLICLIAEMDRAGKDMQHLVTDLLKHFRNLLVCACVTDSGGDLDIAESQTEDLKRQAAGTTMERLLRVADILTETDTRLRNALCRRTLVETSLIRCARAATVVSIEEILRQINALKAAIGGTGVGAAPSSAAPHSESTRGTTRGAAATPEPVVERRDAIGKPAAVRETSYGPTDDVALLKSRWHEIVEKAGAVAPLARSALLDACPLSVDGNRVVIGFDPEFEEHMKWIHAGRNLDVTRNVLKGVLNRSVEVETKLMEDGAKVVLPADRRPESAPAVGAESIGDEKPARKKSPREWMQNEAVRKTVEAFDGEIVDVRE